MSSITHTSHARLDLDHSHPAEERLAVSCSVRRDTEQRLHPDCNMSLSGAFDARLNKSIAAIAAASST